MNPKHVEIVRQGRGATEKWRSGHPNAVLDLRGAQLYQFDMRGADLAGADLSGSNPIRADLRRANLQGADLSGAYLDGADLSGADLRGAKLAATKVSGANFTGATLSGTTFTGVNLSDVKGLEAVRHAGPSFLDTLTFGTSAARLPEAFLLGIGYKHTEIEYLRSLYREVSRSGDSCFLSFSHADAGFAQQLLDRLRDAGLRVWPAPEALKRGSRLQEQIDTGIRSYRRLVLVLSEENLQSEWLAAEVRAAQAAQRARWQRILFPVRLTPLAPHIQEWLGLEAGSADFENWTDPAAFEASLTGLLSDLRPPEPGVVERGAGGDALLLSDDDFTASISKSIHVGGYPIGIHIGGANSGQGAIGGSNFQIKAIHADESAPVDHAGEGPVGESSPPGDLPQYATPPHIQTEDNSGQIAYGSYNIQVQVAEGAVVNLAAPEPSPAPPPAPQAALPPAPSPAPLALPKHTKIRRHTRVLFPAACVQDRKVELRLQLTCKQPLISRVRNILNIALPEGQEETTLDVRVTAPAFAAQSWHQPMTVPRAADSQEIVFSLFPTEKGEQSVEVEFYQEATRVGYLVVSTVVRAEEAAAVASQVAILEEPLASLPRTPLLARQERRTLHVTCVPKEAKIYYTVYSEDTAQAGEWTQDLPGSQAQIQQEMSALNDFLKQVVTEATPTKEEWDALKYNLRAKGRKILDLLVPDEVAAQFREWPAKTCVTISTNEQWIPWELMHTGQDFLSRKFVVARYPRMARRTGLGKKRPTSDQRRTLRTIVNVIGGEVPALEAQRAAQLFAPLGASVRVAFLSERPISALQKSLRGADLLHCTCHGHFDPYMLQIAASTSSGFNLLLDSIADLPIKPGLLVFANACSSTVPVLNYSEFNSFAWEFYRGGADAYVGTLGAVPTEYAVRFAESVYEELFRKGGARTLGEALAAAKDAAEKEHNLFWLLYCINGNPDYTADVQWT